MSKIDIFKYPFSDGSSMNYTPTEAKIMDIIKEELGLDFMPKRLDIRNFYNNGFYGENTIKDLYSILLKEAVLQPDVDKAVDDLSSLTASLVRIMGSVYNDVAYESLDYMFTIALPDMIELTEDKRLITAIAELSRTKGSKEVAAVYDTLDTVMKDPKYRDNKVAYAYCSDLVNKMQAWQCFGSRGFVINLDGTINKYPVVNSYLSGLYDNYEYTVDTKSATVATFYSMSAIRTSETFSNALQTAASLVENVSLNDCGNTDGMIYKVQGPGYNKFNEWGKGDLDSLTGMHYKMQQDEFWSLLRGDEDFLYGETIILRMPFHCKHSNIHTICINCLGRVGLHAKRNFNIGLYLSTRLTDLFNQMVLSAKHLISSAIAEKVILEKETLEYLYVKKKHLLIAPILIGTEFTLAVKLSEFYGYKDITPTNVAQLSHHRLSRISEITLYINGEGHPLPVKAGNKTAIFTKDFLQYVTKNTIEVSSKLVLHVNMKRWKKSMKLLELPETMFDVREYNASIRALLTGNTDETGKKLHKMTRDEFTIELYEAISRKFVPSFSTLGLIAYILGVRNPKTGDFRIAQGDEEYTLMSVNAVLSKGTLSGAFSTGRLSSLNNTDTFSPDKHMDHLLDLYLDPAGVVELEREGYFERDN